MDRPISDLCHWRTDLESDRTGEFWIDREALTQRMSKLSPAERSLFRWGIVEEFNKGLEQILVQDQAVGEMREGFRDHWSRPTGESPDDRSGDEPDRGRL